MILFQAFLLLKPDILNDSTIKVINLVIGSGVIPTLAHRIYRNRKDIFKWFGKLIKKK